MKQYILKFTLTLLCFVLVYTTNAQEQVDSTKQKLIELPFGVVSENRLVGSVDVITGEQLRRSGYPMISTALQGLVPGYNLGRIRGTARGGNDDPLIIIDGLSNRSLGSITIDEVETIHILKDVTAKMLYGSRAANGVIVVTTKRGVASGKSSFSISAEQGYRTATAPYPEFLGAADYMNFRNQALWNDGKDTLYSPEDIALAGTSYKYPDVDWYDEFVTNQKKYQKINAELVGGDDKTQYLFNLGYFGQDGLEKVGDIRRTDILNVRSNLDYAVNNIVSINLDIAGRFYAVKGNHVGESGLFSTLLARKPNDYPLFISDQPHVDSLGTSEVVGGGNLYGAVVYAGYRREEASFAQTNIGMDFNLNQYAEGLTAGIYGTFDINNYIAEGKNYTYRTLKPAISQSTGNDTLIVNGVTNLKGNESRLGDAYHRNIGTSAHVDYVRDFGSHSLIANLSFLMDNKTIKIYADEMSTIQPDRTMNYGIRLNYAYDDKYVAEYTGTYMGSNRFHRDVRWGMFSSFGVSYILSEEDFMDNVSFVDFLKLKASMGTMGYDQAFDFVLYNDYYKYWDGNFNLGVKNAETLVGTGFSQKGNPSLTYEESQEMNLGLSARLLNNTLSLNAEYFTEQRMGMPTVMRYAYPQMAGDPYFIDNYNGIDTKGWELSAQYTNNIGKFTYSLGGYITSYESEYAKLDELYEFDYLNDQGTKVGDIWGYVDDGFYTSADDIATYGAEDGVPLTSSLGTVIPGDLKYQDLSDGQEDYSLDDNVINWYDIQVIGNSTPDYVYGINIHLTYKKVSLYVVGQGVGPFDRSYLYPTYYSNRGNVKYSKFAHDAAVPVFDAEGNAIGLEDTDYTLPRLTTEGTNHSYNTSTFFLRKTSWFKIRTVEINVDVLPDFLAESVPLEEINIFVRGTDLYTISNETDRDPESPSAGLTYSPRFMTITGGVKIQF